MKFLIMRIDRPYNVTCYPLPNVRVPERVYVLDDHKSHKIIANATLSVEDDRIFAEADIDMAKFGALYPHVSLVIEMDSKKLGTVKNCSISGIKLKASEPSDPEISKLAS